MTLDDRIAAAVLDPVFVARVRARIDTSGECWLWTGYVQFTGYGLVYVTCRSDDGRRRNVSARAHRVVWTMENGRIPDGLYVCHRCDTPRCVRPDHLFLGTAADNNRDTRSKGRHGTPRGEDHPRAKMTDDLVRAVRAAALSERQVDICARFGLRDSTVSMLVARKIWRHVE